MIEQFLEAKRREGRHSEKTLSLTAGWLKRCQRFFEPKQLLDLRADDLREWHQALSWSPGPGGKLYSPNTVNQAIGAIRLFYHWAVAENRISTDPSTLLKTPGAKARERWRPTTAEARKLLAMPSNESATGIRDRAILGILLETAIPISVCSRLDLGHLQTDTGVLLAVGRVRRIHSLSEGLLDDLERYLQQARPRLERDSNPALFLDIKGQRLTLSAIRMRFSEYRRRL